MFKVEDWYKFGLTLVIVIACCLAVLQVALYMWGALGAVSELDTLATAVSKVLILAIVASLLLRVGGLLKLKFGGTEMEFEKLVSETSNSNSKELSSIKAELAELRAFAQTGTILAKSLHKGPETMKGGWPQETLMPTLGPVSRKDDPNKGRFGGESTREGYILSAAFLSKGDDRYIKLELSVRKADDAKAVFLVDFFLHGPTFGEAPVRTGSLQGVAKMDLIVWGGFTVGVWIVGTSTLLELDLAEIPTAPRVIREL